MALRTKISGVAPTLALFLLKVFVLWDLVGIQAQNENSGLATELGFISSAAVFSHTGTGSGWEKDISPTSTLDSNTHTEHWTTALTGNSNTPGMQSGSEALSDPSNTSMLAVTTNSLNSMVSLRELSLNTDQISFGSSKISTENMLNLAQSLQSAEDTLLILSNSQSVMQVAPHSTIGIGVQYSVTETIYSSYESLVQNTNSLSPVDMFGFPTPESSIIMTSTLSRTTFAPPELSAPDTGIHSLNSVPRAPETNTQENILSETPRILVDSSLSPSSVVPTSVDITQPRADNLVSLTVPSISDETEKQSPMSSETLDKSTLGQSNGPPGYSTLDFSSSLREIIYRSTFLQESLVITSSAETSVLKLEASGSLSEFRDLASNTVSAQVRSPLETVGTISSDVNMFIGAFSMSLQDNVLISPDFKNTLQVSPANTAIDASIIVQTSTMLMQNITPAVHEPMSTATPLMSEDSIISPNQAMSDSSSSLSIDTILSAEMALAGITLSQSESTHLNLLSSEVSPQSLESSLAVSSSTTVVSWDAVSWGSALTMSGNDNQETTLAPSETFSLSSYQGVTSSWIYVYSNQSHDIPRLEDSSPVSPNATKVWTSSHDVPSSAVTLTTLAAILTDTPHHSNIISQVTSSSPTDSDIISTLSSILLSNVIMSSFSETVVLSFTHFALSNMPLTSESVPSELAKHVTSSVPNETLIVPSSFASMMPFSFDSSLEHTPIYESVKVTKSESVDSFSWVSETLANFFSVSDTAGIVVTPVHLFPSDTGTYYLSQTGMSGIVESPTFSSAMLVESDRNHMANFSDMLSDYVTPAESQSGTNSEIEIFTVSSQSSNSLLELLSSLTENVSNQELSTLSVQAVTSMFIITNHTDSLAFAPSHSTFTSESETQTFATMGTISVFIPSLSLPFASPASFMATQVIESSLSEPSFSSVEESLVMHVTPSALLFSYQSSFLNEFSVSDASADSFVPATVKATATSSFLTTETVPLEAHSVAATTETSGNIQSSMSNSFLESSGGSESQILLTISYFTLATSVLDSLSFASKTSQASTQESDTVSSSNLETLVFPPPDFSHMFQVTSLHSAISNGASSSFSVSSLSETSDSSRSEELTTALVSTSSFLRTEIPQETSSVTLPGVLSTTVNEGLPTLSAEGFPSTQTASGQPTRESFSALVSSIESSEPFSFTELESFSSELITAGLFSSEIVSSSIASMTSSVMFSGVTEETLAIHASVTETVHASEILRSSDLSSQSTFSFSQGPEVFFSTGEIFETFSFNPFSTLSASMLSEISMSTESYLTPTLSSVHTIEFLTQSVSSESTLESFTLPANSESILESFTLSTSLESMLESFTRPTSSDSILETFTLLVSSERILESFTLPVNSGTILESVIMPTNSESLLESFTLPASSESLLESFTLPASSESTLESLVPSVSLMSTVESSIVLKESSTEWSFTTNPGSDLMPVDSSHTAWLKQSSSENHDFTQFTTAVLDTILLEASTLHSVHTSLSLPSMESMATESGSVLSVPLLSSEVAITSSETQFSFLVTSSLMETYELSSLAVLISSMPTILLTSAGGQDSLLMSATSSTTYIVMSSSTLPTSPEPTTTTLPTTTTILPTTTTGPTNNVTTDLLVITVIKLQPMDNTTLPEFKTKMEEGLAKAYVIAFQRKPIANAKNSRKKRFAGLLSLLVETAHTRERRAVSGNVEVKIQDIKLQSSDPQNAELLYTVSENGQPVAATQASDSLNTLLDQELALQLNRVVVTIAKPADETMASTSLPPEDKKLWIIAAVLVPVFLLVLVWVIVCFVVRHKKRRKEQISTGMMEPHLLTVKHGPAPSMEQDEEQRISAPQTRESNGLFKSGTRKMTYEVNPDPGHAAVTSGTDPGLSKKKKKSPKRKTDFPEKPVGDTSAETSNQRASMSRKKKGKNPNSEKTEDLEMSHLNGAGNQTSEDFVKMSYENQLYSQQSFEKYSQSPYQEEDEEVLDNLEAERQKNKQRLRMKKKQDTEIETPSMDSALTAYARAQAEIDKVLGPRNVSEVPDVITGKSEKKRSKRRSKRGQLNEGFIDENENAVPKTQNAESLDDVRTRIHSLLDDAFSLISNSHGSMGSTKSKGSRNFPRNRVVPAQISQKGDNTSVQTSEKGDSTDSDTENHKKTSSNDRASPTGEVQSVDKIFNVRPGEKLHAPMYVDRTHGPYDKDGLITWSPYRASDESARIVLPEAQQSASRAPAQEKLHTTTFMESAANSAPNSSYFTTQPGQPIIIRTRHLDGHSDLVVPSKDRSVNHDSSTGQKTSQTVSNAADFESSCIPYPGMESYESFPESNTSATSQTKTLPSGLQGSGEMAWAERAIDTYSVPLESAPPNTVNSHRPPTRNVGSQDEKDLIVASLQPGVSPKELVDSIRQELKSLSGKLEPVSDTEASSRMAAERDEKRSSKK